MNVEQKNKPKKIAFIDRDGVINKKAPNHCYITSVQKFIFNEGIYPLLLQLKKEGFEFIIITNQRGIARNLLTETELSVIHDFMKRELLKHEIKILDIFYCPHNLNTCLCRKPKPGLLEQACNKYSVDISKSILLSDSIAEVEMGKKFGIHHSYFVPTNQPEKILPTLGKKIRIAIVKFGGLSAGGSEKLAQIIAANLSKERFEVDFFFCDAAPYKGAIYMHPDTSPARVKFMSAHRINCVEFHVDEKDITTPTHKWLGTDFWEKFDKNNYDIIQTVRSGHKEYPFTKIRNTPIIDILGLDAGVDNQFNIARVMQICNWIADRWSSRGGDKKRVEIISLPVQMKSGDMKNMRDILKLQNKFVIGMHQRPSNEIYSDIPLQAYKNIETNDTAFILLGGSTSYQIQARELGLKNIHFLETTGDMDTVSSFLKTLNVYAHGRKDGEVNSQAMAEAMYFGLPIVSHRSSVNNGHVECIADAGVVVDENDICGYATELRKLQNNTEYYTMRSRAAKQRFIDNYELYGQMKRIESIYESVITDSFPHPVRRFLYSLHWTQNIRIWLKWVYLKSKYAVNGKV